MNSVEQAQQTHLNNIHEKDRQKHGRCEPP